MDRQQENQGFSRVLAMIVLGFAFSLVAALVFSGG